MSVVREYDEKLENIRTFEKIALQFEYIYKGKTYNIVATCPRTLKKYEMNLMLRDNILKKMEKFFYQLLICSKKQIKFTKFHKISSYIHILYMMDANCSKRNKEIINLVNMILNSL